MEIATSEKKIKKILKSKLTSGDIKFFDFLMGERACFAVYVDSLTDKTMLGELVLRPLGGLSGDAEMTEIKKSICAPDCNVITTLEDAITQIFDGCTVLFFDKLNSALQIDLKKFETRSIDVPPTSTVIKGPREGFTESIKTNLSLIRRKIKSADLKIDISQIGKYSQTSVAVLYIDSICDKKMVENIKRKISKINIDGIVDSSYISKLIVARPNSLFKQIGNTEKPDVLMAKMLEGRVGILVDGSPLALTLPYMIIEDFQGSEDYFKNIYRANIERFIRFVGALFAVLLPAAFVAAELFHLQLIPLNFLLTIVKSIKGIPLSPSYEMFFTLVIFEILHESSVRMPKYVGMALSVVGALVLGDTAVQAGIISSPTIMIMALSAISLYTVPELVDTMSILRLSFLIIAGSAGAYGIVLGLCFITIYLTSLENFGVPVLAPFAPLVKSDLKDTFYQTILKNMKTRPESLGSKNKTRQK